MCRSGRGRSRFIRSNRVGYVGHSSLYLSSASLLLFLYSFIHFVLCLCFLGAGVAYSWGMGTNGQLGLGNEDDVYEPKSIVSKQLENRIVLAASAGGQHTVLLAKQKNVDVPQVGDETAK